MNLDEAVREARGWVRSYPTEAMKVLVDESSKTLARERTLNKEEVIRLVQQMDLVNEIETLLRRSRRAFGMLKEEEGKSS